MPSRARHLTPIPITEKEYKAVMDKWSDIAEETWDEEESWSLCYLMISRKAMETEVIKDISGNGNDGTMNEKGEVAERCGTGFECSLSGRKR